MSNHPDGPKYFRTALQEARIKEVKRRHGFAVTAVGLAFAGLVLAFGYNLFTGQLNAPIGAVQEQPNKQ